MSTDLTPLLRYCLETARQIRHELYHHVWELIETLAPAADLLDLHRPAGDTR